MDAGTLYHLRNTIHRSNVTDSPKDSFNACEDFFESVVRSHMVAAAMQTLGMKNTHDSPTMYKFPDNVDSLPNEQRKELLSTVARDIVSKYFSLGFNSSKQSN